MSRIIILLFVLVAQYSMATSIEDPPSVQETVKAAKLIVEGYFDSNVSTVLRSYQADDELGNREVVEVHSIRQFHVTGVIQGKVETDLIFINQIGGTYGEYTTRFTYEPVIDELVVVALVDSRYGSIGNRPLMKVMNSYLLRYDDGKNFDSISEWVKQVKSGVVDEQVKIENVQESVSLPNVGQPENAKKDENFLDWRYLGVVVGLLLLIFICHRFSKY